MECESGEKGPCIACRKKGRGPREMGSSGVTVFAHWVVSRHSKVSIGPGVRPETERSGLLGMVWGTGEGVSRNPDKL